MRRSQSDIARARAAWNYRGQRRPAFADTPAAGQESVWDYPRPPVYLTDQREVEVYAGDTLLARTTDSIRALETGSPPTFYLPPGCVSRDLLIPSHRRTFCEWKGEASYFDVKGSQGIVRDAIWCYPNAAGDAAVIAGWLACYPSLLRCFVDAERVRAQAGGYYGGWVTDDIVGPWKGQSGTEHW